MSTAALLLSNLVTIRRLNRAKTDADEARSEVEEARSRYGSLQMDDPNLVHVSRIEMGESRHDWPKSYWLYIPPGHRFFLHVAETNIPDFGEFDTPAPMKTLRMDRWREGANLILHVDVGYDEDETAHFTITTQSDQLFDYPIIAWSPWTELSDGGQPTQDPQVTFRPDEEIRILWTSDVETGHGVVLWMEPLKKPDGET